MKPVSKEVIMQLLTRSLILIIVAKAISLAMLWFLPGEGVNHTAAVSAQPAYQRYTFNVMLEQSSAKAAASKVSTVSTGSHATVRDLVLKGLYGKGESGFVIVALKSNPKKTEVVGIGESFHGYTLVSIQPQSALFDYRGTRYTVTIEASKPLPANALTKVAAPEESGAPKQVARYQINNYTSNLDQVWHDIGIQEVRKENKITGFKVTRIRAGTPFAELGLRKGDIIIKANNKTLDSYAAAMEIYKQIDNIKAVELIVLRNNQEKEIIYEIY
ncbi:MAG: PDZ domain-containing protein [Sulfurimonadaceae bacterium]|nr:PDZ domain-containing protein [Sulfurimonadaceae bacterium]